MVGSNPPGPIMILTVDLWLKIERKYWDIKMFYGCSKYSSWFTPRLIIYSDPEGDWGWYRGYDLAVNVADASWEEIVGTLIHEYWHYLQDPTDWTYPQYEDEAIAVAENDLYLFL